MAKLQCWKIDSLTGLQLVYPMTLPNRIDASSIQTKLMIDESHSAWGRHYRKPFGSKQVRALEILITRVRNPLNTGVINPFLTAVT